MNQKVGFNKELCYLTASIYGGGAAGGTLGYNLCDIYDIHLRVPYLFDMTPETNCMCIGIILGVLLGSGVFRLYQKARKR